MPLGLSSIGKNRDLHNPRSTFTFGAGSSGVLSRVKLRARQDHIGYARQAASPSRAICRVMVTEP